MARLPPPALRGFLDDAVRLGLEPYAASNRLFVRAPGRRAVPLFTRLGELNPAGRYFFRRRATVAPDRRFEPDQEPVVSGRVETIRLNDGSTVKTRTFYGGKWRPTAVGLEFYRTRRMNFIVYFGVDDRYIHDNGRISWGYDERLESTATTLGVVTIVGLAAEAAEAEVRRRAIDYVAGLVPGEHGIVLAEEYYLDRILRDDWLEKLEIRRETVASQDGQLAVEATNRRPLRADRPWLFVDEYNGAIADEAFEEADVNCVVHQMLALGKRNGRPVWHSSELEQALDDAYEKLYAAESPYETGWREEGVTAEMAREVCRASGVPLYIVWNGHIQCFAPEKRDHCTTVLAMVLRGDHAYFLSDPATKKLIADAEERLPRNRPATVVASERRGARVPEAEWLDLPEHIDQVQAGAIYRAPQSEMHDLRVRYHRMHIVPRPKMATATRIVGLTVPILRSKVGATIRALPFRAEDCRKFCANFSAVAGHFPWYGEPMELLSQRALEHLMRPPPRSKITDEVIARVSARQHNKCALCGDPLTHPFHIDHKIARFMGGGDGEECLQGLCVTCHIGKSATECQASVAEENSLLSRFSIEAYELFVTSPKPPQLVADLHKYEAAHGPVANIDVRRCRYSALVEHSGTLPVFSPTDNIVVAGLSLGDYNYCSSSRSRALPWFGPAWYGRETCEYMLHHSIIRWSDISYTFSAAVQLPVSYLRERLAIIAKCWPEEKLAMNSLLGLWAKVRSYRYECHTTRDVADVLFDGPRMVYRTPGADGLLEDVITKTEVLSLASMRPIHQICLEGERLNMARAVFLIKQYCSMSRILSYHVDGIYAQLGRSTDALRERFEGLRYKDLPGIGRFLWRHAQPHRTCSSEALVYRFTCPAELKMPGGSVKYVDSGVVLPELKWDVLLEDGEDFYERVVLPRAKAGSFRLEAPPGYGKSFVLRRLRSDLEEAGETVAVVAAYHVAARQLNCGAVTAHSFVHRHVLNGSFRGVILLDEWPVVSVDIAARLEQCALSGTRIILFGDPLQLRAIDPTWRGRPVSSDALVDSRMLHRWADSTIIQLTKYRRGADPTFAAWFVAARALPDAEAVAEAARKFPATDRKAQWNLVLSHFRRRQINAREQAAEAEEAAEAGKTIYVVAGEQCEYDLFEGTRLIGANSEYAGITNGALLLCESIDGVHATLRDEESGHAVQIRLEVLGRHTRLRHAITLASCQGRTLPGVVRLWDAHSPHMTSAHIYVAASRATAPDLFEVKWTTTSEPNERTSEGPRS